ncbi:hypothetical protein QYE76_067185 [Lolium multiflorum]|uniref:Integrase catalytic domain-containing protein n=1 Tax=Lolium multiflorum TaxID=4521 RepID=A0AAD8SEC4_LOLMU|nr:hypothetical protein QYE76_067185 [Lolium multiflorum]
MATSIIRTKSMERLEQQQEEVTLLAAAQEQARAEEEISGRLPREVLTINRRLDMQQQSMDKMQMDMSNLVAMVTQISTLLGAGVFPDAGAQESMENFQHLKQMTTVNAYVDAFEEWMTRMKKDHPYLPGNFFTLRFISGLKDTLKHVVITHTRLQTYDQLSGYDIILGANWLKRFSPNFIDWEQRSILVFSKGKWLTLYDHQVRGKNCLIIAKAFSKLLAQGASAYVLQLNPESSTDLQDIKKNATSLYLKSWDNFLMYLRIHKAYLLTENVTILYLFKKAKLFIDNIFKLHGMPAVIVSDRDRIFTSKMWHEVFTALKVDLRFSTAYHPETDGQTERVNQSLEQYLGSMTFLAPTKWSDWLPLAEWWYNSSYHTSIKTLPFQALYEYPPPQIQEIVIPEDGSPETQANLREKDHMLKMLQQNLEYAQAKMKKFADTNSRNFVEVLKKVGTLAYKLQLPPGTLLHDVFHVNQLKKHLGPKAVPNAKLPMLTPQGKLKVKPQAILETRQIPRRAGDYDVAVPQWLVHWENMTADEATWEDAHYMMATFPGFVP